MIDGRDPIIVLDHVSKAFGTKPVLQDVSLTVAQGEALCLLGRSGMGKSVTLKLIIALLAPDIGRIRIAGEDITELDVEQLSHVRRRMGFLFQSAALFDSFTVYDNLALPLRRFTSKSKGEIQELVDFVLNEVGLLSDKNKMPVELSGGMRKRAGLARALILGPEILLVDEPSSGLDRITASEIDDLLLREKTKQKTTMVIVTHDARGARRVGDRFAVLDRGRLLALGTADELDEDESPIVQQLFEES